MLQLVSAGALHIITYPVDPQERFEPGMIGELKVAWDNTVVLGIGTGLCPLGIIDDVKNGLDDTTQGSGKVTIHLTPRSIWRTDQFEYNQHYMVNSTLYCGLDGKFTTAQPTFNHPSIGIVLHPPTLNHPLLELLWF